MPQTVLILDPDADFAQLLAEQLTDAGLQAVIAPDAAAALARIAAGGVAALVTATMLHGASVVDLCRHLRAEAPAVAVILLGSPGDPIGLLDATGADEEFVRPIRLGNLIGRLRSLMEAAASEVVGIGPYRFDSAAKYLTLENGSAPIHLTEKETAILLALARAGDAAVPREQLLREVWRYNPEVTTHTLETHVYRLRQKMETDAAPGPFLLTEAGGYRLAVG